MRICPLVVTLAVLAAPASAAQNVKCPYETTVETEAYVRCGPGSKYYPQGDGAAARLPWESAWRRSGR